MSKNEVSYLAGAEQAIPLERLRPFANHPFQVRHDLEMRELMDSIGESGIITPILVRPKENGLYEVISGHRRWEACKELGVQQIPAKVLYLDDDEATVLMVNSNIQREHVLPSEKAFAYKMRYDALAHQGITSRQVGAKLRTSEQLAQDVSESARQIQRYIRLTQLIPPILQMVDEGRIAFNPAVEISYMTEEHQRWLKEEMDLCDAHAVPCAVPHAQGDEPQRHADRGLPEYPAYGRKAEPTSEILPEPVGRAALLPRHLHPRTDAERHLPLAAQLGA